MNKLAWCVLAMGLVACNVNSWDPPIKPTAEYPCGPFGNVCVTQHGCCDEDETCGGEPMSVGCPAAMCCMAKGGFMADRDGGVTMHPQTAQKSTR